MTVTLESLNINAASVYPMLLLTGLSIAVLVLDLFLKKERNWMLGWLSVIGLLIILPLASSIIETEAAFGGMVLADRFSGFFNVIFILSAVLTLIISMDYVKKAGITKGEYYYITLFAVLGMMVMASSNDLLNLYVGLELMALSFYVLVAFRPGGAKSAEGALKYFILGALSSAVLLYGISFVYGFSGTTNIAELGRVLAKAEGDNQFLFLAIALITVGFSFKIAAFPFHIWAPDAYEGAPTPVTAFLSIGSKAAAFAVFLRVFIVAFPAIRPHWGGLLWALSAATMLFGSVVAISQKNMVRMLAYSSIAHAGIIMMGLLVYNSRGVSASMYYLLVYTFMNMGAFTAAAVYMGRDGGGELISDYRGLASRQPILALLMSLFLLSLAGIPPTGGFAAKFFILASAIDAGYYYLAATAVIATAISLYFYAKVIFYMFIKEAEAGMDVRRAGVPSAVVLALSAIATMVLGLYPQPFIDMAVAALKPLIL